MELNVRQERFCQEFVLDLRGGPAAVRADYSPQGAEQTASRLLTVPKVKARVRELKNQLADAVLMNAKDVLKEASLLAMSNIVNYIDEDGYLIGNLKDIPRDVAAAISSIDQETLPNGTVKLKIRLWDKNKALQLTGRHVDVQAFLDRVEVTDGLSDRLARMKDVTPVTLEVE